MFCIIEHLWTVMFYIFHFSGAPVHFDDIGKFLHDVDLQLV